MIPNFLWAVPDSITLLLAIDKCYISGLKHGGGAWVCPRWVSLLPYLSPTHTCCSVESVVYLELTVLMLIFIVATYWRGLALRLNLSQHKSKKPNFNPPGHIFKIFLSKKASLGMERMEKSDWGHGKIFQIDPPRQCCCFFFFAWKQLKSISNVQWSEVLNIHAKRCYNDSSYNSDTFLQICCRFCCCRCSKAAARPPGFSLLPTYSGVYWGASNATPVLFFSSRPSWFEKSASWTRLRSFSPPPSLSSPFCQATADTSTPCITRAQFWPTTMQVGAWWRKTSGERCIGKEFKRQ